MISRSVLLLGLAVSALAVVIGFLGYLAGGFDVFQPPVEIVVLPGAHGLVCATSRPGTLEDTAHVVRHELTADGLLVVDGDVLRSHRPVKILEKTGEGGSVKELVNTQLFPWYTETDPEKGLWYAVYWLGQTNPGPSVARQPSGTPLCLGRFAKVATR